MRKIAIALSKGGVGKTTTAVNVAHGLAIAGRRVLLIDTDTQNQCAKALGVDPVHSLADLMLDNLTLETAVSPARDKLDLLAGGDRLAVVANNIAQESIRPEETLRRMLSPQLQPYDYVIIDSSPSWDNLSINVLFFASELLCPCNLDQPALDGLIAFLKRVKGFSQYHDISLNYILPTALDKRVAMTEHIRQQLDTAFNNSVCEPIPYNAALGYAYAYGQTIFEYEPTSPSASAYANLVQRIIDDE